MANNYRRRHVVSEAELAEIEEINKELDAKGLLIHVYESNFGTVKLNKVPLKGKHPRFRRQITLGDHEHTTENASDSCPACQAERGLGQFLTWVFMCGGIVEEIKGSI